MIYVFLTNNLVTDVARVPPATIFHPNYAAQFIEAPDNVTLGWTYVDGTFNPPSPPPPAPPPYTVTMRQARLALLQTGKLNDVSIAIASLPSPEKEAAQIEWEYATEVSRTSTLVTQLAPALGLNEQALDNLFIQASKL